MTGTYAHVYLAPHYDDASLSCGGYIHDRVVAGQSVLVITIFASPPESGRLLSPFAQELHRSWGDPGDVVAARQAEDRTAMNILGADYLRLNLGDAIYRGNPEAEAWYYTSDADLFSRPHPAEASIQNKIADAIRELVPIQEETVLYAPLAVGNHVDHQLGYAAAWQLRRRGWRIAFYEDYPYADPGYPFTRPAYPWEHRYTLEKTLEARRPATLQPRVLYFSGKSLQAKVESVRAYTSQVAALFGDGAEMERLLRRYALDVGGEQPAERFWLPD